jgi:hypothetical protein
MNTKTIKLSVTVDAIELQKLFESLGTTANEEPKKVGVAMTFDHANGILRILAERQRQITEEGWTPDMDDQYVNGDLVLASVCYAAHAQNNGHMYSISPSAYQEIPPPSQWPWISQAWKPKNPIRDLERAGALISAELDRRLRLQAKTSAGKLPG